MVGLVIVSHSSKVAEGICDMALQLAAPGLRIAAAGGLADGAIGTDAVRIQAAIEAADTGDGVLILVDLGSAVLSADLALELIDSRLRARVSLADAPLLEGAIAAAVEASLGSSREKVAAAAGSARNLQKF